MSARPWLTDPRYWDGQTPEESRQHYANVGIATFQRARARMQRPVTFAELLQVFRYRGQLYDLGARLRDEMMDGAA